MNLPQDFANVDTAREIAHNLYPDTKNITMIEHSADNIVALIDTDYAVRFPRHKNAYLRGQYEKHILDQLEEAPTITIPRVLGEHANPPYIITSFVLGHHLSSATVRTLPQNLQQEFATAVAKFAYTMHTSFALDEELPLRKELGLDELEAEEPWPIYFKRVVKNGHFQNPVQDGIAKKCYTDWSGLCDVAPTVVVHDDLHTENMMFDDANHLTGVLDFGDANVGTPEQELRQLYRISEEVTQAAVQEYQRLSGRQLNVEAVKLWAIMKELADYSRRLVAQSTSHHSFKRTSHNLNIWLPEGEWGKGYDLSSIESHQ
jgi:aminoglycoside phosphotransferase (APT) family kinase protein